MQGEILSDRLIFLVHEVLTPDECRELIRSGEAAGFSDAPITTSRGFVMRKDIRNNTRVIRDDPEWAVEYGERLRDCLVPVWQGRRVVGLNERFRFYRYQPGQRFARHYDGAYERENGERSEFSLLFYLNDDFSGGETVFYEPERIEVRPRQGTALIFQHHLLHEGAVVTQGVKYVLRTDVMYSALE
jgi:prolyl 4-hydroxylase